MIFTVKAKEKAFDFSDVPVNRLRFLDFLKENEGKTLQVEVEPVRGAKSAQALGYYWGALLPAIVARNKGIHYADETIGDLLKEKRITTDEIDQMHCALMTEFRPQVVTRLDGTQEKQRGEMKKMGNRQLLPLITEVIQWFEQNYGCDAPNPGIYKAVRDGARALTETGKFDYPSEDKLPNF